jgi:cytochrome c oxidase subunit 3
MQAAPAQIRTVIPLHPERAQHATGMVGMILFLSSWAMLFGALFYAYGILRLRSVMWPPAGTPELPIVIPTVITGLLIASAVAVEAGRRALAAKDETRFQRMVIAAIVLGGLFLALQSQVWVDLWAAGLQLDTDRFGSLFYFLTAFHALHVVVGLGILTWMLGTTLRLESPIARNTRAQFSAMFWHFVGAVWLVIYPLVYLF